MQRYFLLEQLDGDEFQIPKTADIYQHFGKVLRATVGSEAEFVDNQQRLVVAKVTAIDPQEIKLTVVRDLVQTVELPVRVTIVVSPIKNDRSDWLVQKATELGVDRIVFTQMNRSVVSWQKQAAKKQVRLGKIALAAAQQAHRLKVPTIELCKPEQALALTKDLGLVAWEEAAKTGESSQLVQQLTKAQADAEIVIWFGPEGGLSEQEIAQLTARDYLPVGLGPRILRAETAPLYALAGISLLKELQ